MHPMYLEQGLKGKNRWWRYLLSALITLAGALLGNLPLMMVLSVKFVEYGADVFQKFQKTMDFALIGLSPAAGLVLMMIPFASGLGALLLAVRLLHGRRVRDFATAAPRFRFGRFFIAAGIWMTLGIIADLVSFLIHPGDYRFVFDLTRFIPVLIAALIMVPLQTGFEEFLFRGYLSHALASLFKGRARRWGRILPMVLTGTLFGVFHVANPEIANYGLLYMLPQYVLMGLLFSVISVMDDGLEAAWGIHWANNLYGILLVSVEGTAIQTPSVFQVGNYDPRKGLVYLVLSTVIGLVIYKLVFRWPGFRKAVAPLEVPESPSPSVVAQEPSLTQD